MGVISAKNTQIIIFQIKWKLLLYSLEWINKQ